MLTLRSKIVIFVTLLLIGPAIPLSYFVLQLLDKSYHIGVNPEVETALDGALNISADLYQMHKTRFEAVLEDAVRMPPTSQPAIRQFLQTSLDSIKISIDPVDQLGAIESMFFGDVIHDFIISNKSTLVWPSPDHARLHGLALIHNQYLLQVIYPLPASFRESARRIQDVSQIYKTLGYVRSDIRRSFLFTFLTIYGVVIISSLIVLSRISKTITNPIRQLTTATRQIGTGDLSYRLHLKGQDEFGQLAASFNRMVSELADNQQKILELEKMAAWQQLARRLAHEIKNPLTPIQLMAQQMRDTYSGDDPAYRDTLNQCSDIINDEVESLKRLVREFSDFARLPEFHIERQQLISLLHTIKALYRQTDIQLTTPDTVIELPLDSEYIKRALINLIDNAIAASGEHPHVEMRVTEIPDAVQIDIADQGEGIPADRLAKIFEPYYSTKRTGVGLGLPIVKKIVEEHGGSITVQSIVGEGTTFTITLPRQSDVNRQT
ncbi:HAMP domain-containing protein [candidate division KSB1 bacterium]|nr:HAMP domain-containing protein [candidate division KSB1 bacterium]